MVYILAFICPIHHNETEYICTINDETKIVVAKTDRAI